MGKTEVPIYLKIHDEIKELIEAGKWQIGDRLPSERELSEQFAVSRMTLRQAIKTLADEGILERKVGSGTYVASSKVQEKMSGVTSFTEIIEAQGRVPSSKTISFKKAKPSNDEIKSLQIKATDDVLRMERIRYADDEPICFEITTIPYAMISSLTKNDLTTSLYKSAEAKLNLSFGKATQTITAITASDKITELLNLSKGSAILFLRQVTLLQDGRPFEYVRSQYAGQRFEFLLEK